MTSSAGNRNGASLNSFPACQKEKKEKKKKRTKKGKEKERKEKEKKQLFIFF